MNKFAEKTKNKRSIPINNLLQTGLAVTGTSLMALGVMTPQAAKAVNIIYSNNFSAGAGPEWSNSTTTTSPSGEKFLGTFASQNTTLTVPTPVGTKNISLSFDFYAINTWDGNNTTFGPDFWGVKVVGAPSPLLQATFSNGNSQSFGGQGQPLGDYPFQTGASAVNSLGYAPIPNSTYRFTFNFAYNQPTLALNFYDLGLQNIADESWGIDNVQVAAVPWETDSLSLLASTSIFGLAI